MKIDIRALEAALSPIQNLSQAETIVDIGGVPITIQMIPPSAELEIQRYANEALVDEEDTDQTRAAEFLDRFRLMTLSHAIVQVGDLDFRGVSFVETGETLEDGTPIRIPKVKALRDLVGRWSRSILIRVYRKYADLYSQVEEKTDKVIKFDPSDRDAEIDRLTERLKELQEAKKTDVKNNESFIRQLNAVAQAVEHQEAAIQQMKAPVVQAPVVQTPVVQAPSRRAPISPPVVPPPSPVAAPSVPVPAQATPVPPVVAPVHRPPQDSSFVNAEDEQDVDAAMEEEHLRLLEMRRGINFNQPANLRRPPHADALEAERDVGIMNASVQQARLVGQIGGAEVFALPPQELSVRGTQLPVNPQVLNPTPKTGSSNPRFQPPRRP